MTTISLCMIVKNEEKYLNQCLLSATELVDEIIIVDTGSTDKTIEIAKNAGANVLHFDWINDFSAARNFGIQHATGEWILYLDADETLDLKNIADIRDILKQKKNLAYEIEIHNISHEDKMPFIHKSVRLFQNNKDLLFRNKVHEQISLNGNSIPYYEIATIPFIINHIGYRDDVVQEKNKQNRNFDILKQEIKTHPNDKFAHFNIANEFLKNGDYINAIYHYKVATNNKKDKEMLAHSMLRMMLALYELKRFDEMFILIEEGKRNYPDYTDIFYFQGDILEKIGREEEAKYLYEECLRLGNPKKRYVTRKGVGDVLPLKKLADLYLKHDLRKKAADTLLKLLTINRYDEKVTHNLLKLYKLNFSENDLYLVIKELYPSDEGLDLVSRLKFSYSLRIVSLFTETYEQIKTNLPEYMSNTFDFYYYLSKKEHEIAKEILTSGKLSDDIYFIQYFLVTKDLSIYEYTNINIKKIMDYYESKKKNKAFELSEDTYMLLIEELLKMSAEDDLSFYSELKVLFNFETKGKIGNVFYSYFRYDYAVTFYQEYLKERPSDFMVVLILAELSLITGYEVDAIKYAHEAMLLNDSHFRSVEIILESYKQLGENEDSKALAKEMMKYFPYDNYLKSFQN